MAPDVTADKDQFYQLIRLSVCYHNLSQRCDTVYPRTFPNVSPYVCPNRIMTSIFKLLYEITDSLRPLRHHSWHTAIVKISMLNAVSLVLLVFFRIEGLFIPHESLRQFLFLLFLLNCV